MKKTIISLALATLLAGAGTSTVLAADDGYYPKSELRAAWMANLGIDWPLTNIRPGADAAEGQKQEIIRYLNAMKGAGINCVFVHMRPMSDRLYARTSYGDVTIDEPWSVYMTGTRGVAPDYDPLEYWITEAHARGMEVHAWLNPYRYNNYVSSTIPDESFNPYTTEHDKQVFESGWLLRHTYYTSSTGKYTTNYIYNPADERTTKLICDVCTVLGGAYDLDGIIFDDYFYPDGIKSDATAGDWADYQAYRDGGGNMSIADWRRNNVNMMIKTVYATIKSVKPWLRFGVSPAGAAGKGLKPTDGLPALSQFCAAGDWQYAGIFSDPMAWMRDQDLDYISPQLYWTSTHSTNPFGPMAAWWSIVANKFGRHFFASNYVSSLASNNNDAYRAELCKQVTLQRQAIEAHGGEPGIVFFSAKIVDGYTNYGLERALKETNFSREALIPAMTWHQAVNPGLVSDIARTDNHLTWTGFDNMRYTVYAVPASIPQENFDGNPDYLLGFTYTPDFDIPADRQSGYNYAICAYDRFGYEYSARFLGAAEQTLDAPTLLAPADGVTIELPATLTWTAVEGARTYAVEIARNPEMTDFVMMTTVGTNECSTDELDLLPVEQQLYWRVRACAPNYNDGVSATRAAVFMQVRISSPDDAAIDASLEPEIRWTMSERDIKVQIATTATFGHNDIIYEADATGGTHQVPRYRLSGMTQYFVRGLYTRADGTTASTDVISFVTRAATPAVPAITLPTDGGDLYSDQHITLEPVDGPRLLRLEVSASRTFPSRTSYIQTDISMDTWCDAKAAGEITISNAKLTDGKTYYARVRGTFATTNVTTTVNTDYSEPISFVYHAEESGVADATTDGILSVAGSVVTLGIDGADATLTITDMSGRTVATPLRGNCHIGQQVEVAVPSGAYLATLTTATLRRTVKMIVR